ncbi:Coiled-coil and C2 domain-containing protein 2A [Dermatophagoides farinae]|uniref:Coiled-coil and C2 domain-containing protein 2A n=1 Tax=Dermatophagoides farinae TaxID=6954 RepID=A0A922L368_DERFA|nr:Coiled-coil and C2 domain-containing protein 2A [Dermatophagoides farinae]
MDKSFEDDSSIDQKIRRRLSNDWRKTLERVLNCSDGYLDNKLEISRKDAIQFFINNVWQDDCEESDGGDDEYPNETSKNRRKGKNNKKRSKQRSTQSSVHRAVQFYEDSDQVPVVRRARIPWSHHNQQHKKIDINHILTAEFDAAITDDDEIDTLQHFIGRRAVSRLIKEQIEFNQFFRIHIMDSFQERFVFHEPGASAFQDLMLSRHNDLVQKSKLFPLLARSLIFILNVPDKSDPELCLNNKSFILNLWKHPTMSNVDKNVKKLLLAFKKYENSISSHSNRMLDTMEQQIDSIANKLENSMPNDNKELIDDEIRMDLDLLQRLLEKHDKLIADRRQSLINLIQQWSLFQNNLDQCPDSDELHEIDLRLDEIETIDTEKESKQLKELVAKREKIHRLIVDVTKVNDSQLNKEKIFLCDGRLPGEPKFRPIELILPQKFSSSTSSSSSYCIEIVLGNKIVAAFENHHLNYRTFQTFWDLNYRSFPVPICLDPVYPTSLIITEGEEAFIANKLPKIRIKEKNNVAKTIKSIAEINIKSLPSSRINSRQRSIRIEETFQCLYDEIPSKKKSKNSVEGSLEFRMFWSSLPESNIDLDLFVMYDVEKRQIKQMAELKQIEQWLHDIRYQVDFSDSTKTEDHDDQLNYHRQIELMQLLLRQKYNLEIAALYEEKKLHLNKLTYPDVYDNHHQSSEDGSFCTTEKIEQNKRFQMMIQRQQGQVDYRFLPLTNTDVLFINDQTNNKLEKSSTNKLLDFIRLSSKQQFDRILGEDQNDDSVVIFQKLYSAIDDQSQLNSWYKAVTGVLTQIWEHSIKLDNKQTEPEIISLNEIIKEQTFDNVSGINFSWLDWLFKSPSVHNRKLNPSRRNRHKEALNISEAIEGEIQIHLLLQHAANVPLKINRREKSSDLLSQSCSFVEIKIDHNQQTMSTSFSDGSKPSWNESFKFKTKLIPTNHINLNLFSVKKHTDDSDPIKFDMSNDENSKLERCWLGQLQLPLYVLMFVPKLEGFICVVDNLEHRSVLATRFLAPLKPPTFDELSPIQFELKNEKKKAKLSKLAYKDHLYILLIIRYVSLISSLLESNQHIMNLSANRRFFDRWSKSNIWMDAYQFLTIRIGCQAEHAILLACFLQYMNKKAYIAIGTGLLDGPTAYVIIYPESIDTETNINSTIEGYDAKKKDVKNKWILIDAKRGRQFFVQDYHCTMISIDSIITPDNIYANVQKSTHPNSISYDLHRTNRWQPLFNPRNQSASVQNLDISIQPQTINYGSIRSDWAKLFEIKVETYLREQFMSWRRHQTGSYTQFNRFCMQIIKQLLPELERHTVLIDGNRSYSSKLAELEDLIQRNLKQILDVYEMISYPLNIVGHSAADLDQLSRLIYATNLHLTHFGHPNQVEYVISCYVHPYPSDLFSLWIFLAALTTKSIAST